MKKIITTAVVLIATVSLHAEIVIDYDFNELSEGTIVQANTAQYDYTSAQAYVGSNAVPNTLAFNGRSTGTDYIIRDKGLGHENALFLKTINTVNTDFGIYLNKIDFTAGGANASQVVRVSYSFDILGFDSNDALDPTGWTIKINTDNNSENLGVSDGWFSDATLAQTFSFNDDSAGETAADGTWTTVSGYFDIGVGQGGTLGGIQISTDNGGYTSAGGVFLDNIQVDVTAIPEPATIGLFGLAGLVTFLLRRLRS